MIKMTDVNKINNKHQNSTSLTKLMIKMTDVNKINKIMLFSIIFNHIINFDESHLNFDTLQR